MPVHRSPLIARPSSHAPHRMSLLDALWHLLGFLAPAAGVAVIASALAKLCWWRALRGVAWWRLAAGAAAGGTTMSVVGWLLFGHDGEMATYAALVTASAVAMGWIGFVRRR